VRDNCGKHYIASCGDFHFGQSSSKIPKMRIRRFFLPILTGSHSLLVSPVHLEGCRPASKGRRARCYKESSRDGMDFAQEFRKFLDTSCKGRKVDAQVQSYSTSRSMYGIQAAPVKFEAELFAGKPTSGLYCSAIRYVFRLKFPWSCLWTLWHRTSPFEGLVKFATVAGALATAALLWCVIPAVLRLRAPVQLAQANQALPAETALRARQEMFTQLFECVPDALILANAAGEIVAVNSQAERLFGYARQELWGQSIELLVPERFHHRHREHREHYMAAPRARAMGEGLALVGAVKGAKSFSSRLVSVPCT
jgi:PAS domain-containing protein